MTQLKIHKELRRIGIVVNKLDKAMVINGELNPVLEVLVDDSITTFENGAITFKIDGITHIMFISADIHMKLDKNLMITYLGIGNYSEDLFIRLLLQDKNYSVVSIRISNKGMITLKRLG